jgi:hypothetical protein
LRDAAALNGFYKNPRTAAERFGKIANEIEAACSDGRLRCHRSWVTYLPRITGQQSASLPRTLLDAVEMIAHPIGRAWQAIIVDLFSGGSTRRHSSWATAAVRDWH